MRHTASMRWMINKFVSNSNVTIYGVYDYNCFIYIAPQVSEGYLYDCILTGGGCIQVGRQPDVPDVAYLVPGPRLNIKTVLSTYGDFHVKDKTAVRTSYL